jgi:uncharacterized membrane protein
MKPSSHSANSAGSAKIQGHWQELDVLRGIAAIMMIVNHAGVALLMPQYTESGLTAAFLFVGSFAPVMFFFVTGVGSGIQHSQGKKASRWASILNKVGILVLADLLMAWSGGDWWRLDFLGFIGLSTLVLELVRVSKAPIVFSVVGVVGITLLRYVVGPIIHQIGLDEQFWGLGFVLGTKLIPGISYPLSPWLAYPLLGFLTGILIARSQKWIEQRRVQSIVITLVAAALPAILSLVFVAKGAVFFRWGSVSLAFYVASFVTILLCIALALIVRSSRRLDFMSDRLSLKGISSLAVVPIHYFLIDSLTWAGMKEVQPVTYYLLGGIILILSFSLSYWVEQAGNVIRKAPRQSLLRNILIGAFVTLACIALASAQANPSIAITAKTIGQIILCFLFVLPPNPRLRQLQPN